MEPHDHDETSSPEEFRDPIEKDVEEGQEFVEEVALPPPEIDAMEDMAQTAEEIAEPALETPEPPAVPEVDDPGLSPFEQALSDMESMSETALGTVEKPPDVLLDEMEDMEQAATQDLPPERTQAEQVNAAEHLRSGDLFQFDTGTFDADMGNMDWVGAESSYREVNFQWQRLMTAMVVDHQHRLEQLLAMLERER